jgi:subtilisin family serine protease
MARDQVSGLTLREFPEIGWEHIQIDPSMDVQTAVQKMLQQPGVISAEPNYIRRALTTVPNDFQFGLQWALQNTGQTVNGTAGTAGADISATTAWDLRMTSSNIIVAVIDTGIDTSHPDLSSNLWVNPGEIAGNGVDDDSNGKVDDVNGWDFVNNDNNPADDNGHGTYVSGIIGGKGNDSIGIAGVTWAVRLMILKILDSTGFGTVANEVSAIQYATTKGAHIINASLGGSLSSQAEKDAIDAFPGLFVAAAGNSGTDDDAPPSFYPACYTSPNIIAVAATDQNDALASFSDFGTTCVDLAAPGVNIISDFPGVSLAVGSGTSAATPFVSGVAALLKAQEPNRTTAEIRSAILNNVDVKASLSGKVATGGRLNARAALAAIPPLAPTALAGTAASATQINLTWTDNSAGETGYEVQRKTGSGNYSTLASLAANSVSYSDTTTMEVMTYSYRVRASNSGANSDFSNEVSVTTPLAAPTGLTAMAASTTSIALTWIDNSAVETGYEIQRMTGTGSFATLATIAANVTSYLDSGLAEGTTYSYRVRATGPGGTSAFSLEVSLTTPGGGGGGGGGGGCFIATAAYGSPQAAEVQVLREFRDRFLLTNAPGRLLVRAYYRVSPPLARIIAANERLRIVTRAVLRPVIWSAHVADVSPGLALTLGGGALVVGPISPVLLLRVRRSRARSGPRSAMS